MAPADLLEALVLDDGNRGNLNQSLGIAEKLAGARVSVHRVGRLSAPARFGLLLAANSSPLLPRRFCRRVASSVLKTRLRPTARARRVVFSAGGKLAPLNVLASRAVGALSVHVLYPEYLRPRLFDLLVVPEHDRWRYRLHEDRSGRLMLVAGAPNRVSPERLAGRPGAAPPGGVLAVLVGGSDRHYTISTNWAEALCRRLVELSGALPARVLLATSRRTPREAEAVFRSRLGSRPGFELVLVGEKDANPVLDFLARASLVLVTEDSVSMASEAASSGKPAAVLKVGRKRPSALVFDRTLARMEAEGFLEVLALENLTPARAARLAGRPPARALGEAARVAGRVAALVQPSGGMKGRSSR